MSATSYIESVRLSRGLEKAYEEAVREVRQRAAELEALWASRFFERRTLDDGTKKLWPTTEARISSAHDMADCGNEPVPEFLYCDDDGELYSVTVGQQQRHGADPDGPDETPFHYASSAMVANGKVVGCVKFTDH